MKKILFILSLCMSCSFSFAQSVTTDPAEFTGDDEVTFTFDLTGVNITGPVYLWAWIQEGCPSNCDAPTNVNPAGPNQAAARLTQSAINPNIYTITFVPSEFYNKPATQMSRIGMIAKGADWSNGQTPDLFLNVQPPVFESPVIRIFPTEFSADDIVTIFYDTNLEEDAAMKAEGEYYLLTTIEGKDANGDDLDPADYYVTIDSKTKLVAVGNGIYRISFIPNKFYDLSAGDIITSIRYLIQNGTGTLRNPPVGFDILGKTVRQKVN